MADLVGKISALTTTISHQVRTLPRTGCISRLMDYSADNAPAPWSSVHIRGLIRALWEFAMWRGDIPLQRNPMELVSIKNGSKRVKQTHSLNPQEVQLLFQQLNEPFRTIALLCVCFGLRISEFLGPEMAERYFRR